MGWITKNKLIKLRTLFCVFFFYIFFVLQINEEVLWLSLIKYVNHNCQGVEEAFEIFEDEVRFCRMSSLFFVRKVVAKGFLHSETALDICLHFIDKKQLPVGNTEARGLGTCRYSFS